MLSNRYFIAAVAVGLLLVAAYNVYFFRARGRLQSAEATPVPEAAGPPQPQPSVAAPQAPIPEPAPEVAPQAEAVAPTYAPSAETETRRAREIVDLLASCNFKRNPFLGGSETTRAPLASPRHLAAEGPQLRLVGILTSGERRVAIIRQGEGEGSSGRVLAEGDRLGERRLAWIGTQSVELVGPEGRLRLELAQ